MASCHSALSTVSNSSRPTMVKTMSYPANNFKERDGENSAVSVPVVACTIDRMAGIEMGKSSNGSMSSRLRVRNEIAAKNVPLTTSAQVQNTKTTANCHVGPSERKL